MNAVGGFLARPAAHTDQHQISHLISTSSHVHRHLDWRHPLDWIGSPPFIVLESQGQVVAALGCPPDPPSIAWIRLFTCSDDLHISSAWETLWEIARPLLTSEGSSTSAAIVMNEWFQNLLQSSGFSTRQDIVMLERNGGGRLDPKLPAQISLRTMMVFDLPEVTQVDGAAFDLIWQNSLPTVTRAFSQAIWPSVAELDGQVIGYQLSTRNPHGVHLARLATRPDMQGMGVAGALVADLINKAAGNGITHITVNTQSDNAASHHLYDRLGFIETGERYPVYRYG